MLTKKQIRMLELLCKQIQGCLKCNLYSGGRCRPFYTPKSKYVIIGEAPGSAEVRRNEPFVGPAGRILWEAIFDNKLRPADFAVINSVNCRPTDGQRNLKPTHGEMNVCRQWIRKFIKVIKPERILILGTFAMSTLLHRSTGITRFNATDGVLKEFDNTPYLLSVHPAYTIYNKEKGPKMLNESLKKFKNMKDPIKIGFLDDSLFEI